MYLIFLTSSGGRLQGEETFHADLAGRIAKSIFEAPHQADPNRMSHMLAQADVVLLSGIDRAGFTTSSGPDGPSYLLNMFRRFLIEIYPDERHNVRWQSRRSASTPPAGSRMIDESLIKAKKKGKPGLSFSSNLDVSLNGESEGNKTRVIVSPSDLTAPPIPSVPPNETSAH